MKANRSMVVVVALLVAAVGISACGEGRTDPVVGEWVQDKSEDAINAYLDAMERYATSSAPAGEDDDSGPLHDQLKAQGVIAKLGFREFPKTAAERREFFGNNIRMSKALTRYEPDGRALSLKHPGDPNPQVFRWRRKGDVIEVFIPEMGDMVMITANLDGHRLWTEDTLTGVREAWIRRD